MVNPNEFSVLDYRDNMDDVIDPDYWPEYALRISGVAIADVRIGTSATAYEDLTAIEYAGDRAIGSGPGGDHISLQTVLNTHIPIGILHHHKWLEIVMGIREDEFQALYNTNVGDSLKAVVMDGENTPIDYFAITMRDLGGIVLTKIYDAAKTFISGVDHNKLVNEEGKYITEVKLIYTGNLLPGLDFHDGFEDIIDPNLFSKFDFYEDMETITDQSLFSATDFDDPMEED